MTAAMANKLTVEQGFILVVGLGVTGLSVVRHLKQAGETVAVADSRQQPPGLEQLMAEFPDVPVYVGAFDEAVFSAAKQLVVSPGVAIAEPVIQQALAQGVEVTGDIELFAQKVKAPVIAITGSNGKSTVTTLVGEMAKAAGLNVAVGGNLGSPALDLLHADRELYVLELSSFQLETLHSLEPVAATVLNISPDHLDRYDSYDHYAQVKAGVYRNCTLAVINRDDILVKQMAANEKSVTGFTLHEPAKGDFGLRQIEGQYWLCCGEQALIAEHELRMGGRHNTANALAALALGEAAGIEMDAMLHTLRQFPGLPHRSQWVAEKNQVSWYNDSKGTNVGATLAAIEGLNVKNKIILIAGGQAKDADFSALKSAVQARVRSVVLIGEDAAMIDQALGQVVPVVYAENMTEAVAMAAEQAQPGDSVLLSPACASFDMFKGFAHRGEMFVQAVEALL